MNWDDRERRLNEYLDGTLSENDRNQVARRIAQDPEWTDEYARMKALRDRAGALPRTIEPPRDLWPGIVAKIAPAPAPVARRRIWSLMPQWTPAGLALAAALVLAILLRPEPSPVPSDRPGELGASVASGTLPVVVQALDYECLGAGKQLAASVRELRNPIGGNATASIRNDLTILESAIEETRTALENDPDNPRVLRILTELYEQKLSLLHRAMQLARVA